MRNILAALFTAVLFPTVGNAGDWIAVSGASVHFERQNEFRQWNPGLGWERSTADWDGAWMAGYYRNSYDRDTVYAGARWTPIAWGSIRAGLFGAAISGYWTPIALLPTASIEGRRFGLNVVAAPTVREYVGYVGVQVKVRLD